MVLQPMVALRKPHTEAECTVSHIHKKEVLSCYSHTLGHLVHTEWAGLHRQVSAGMPQTCRGILASPASQAQLSTLQHRGGKKALEGSWPGHRPAPPPTLVPPS